MKLKYIKQIVELIKGLTTKYPSTMSCVLACPQCGEYQMLQCVYFGNTYVWDCINRDCSFKTDEIPSIKDMKELFKLDKKLQDLKILKHYRFLKEKKSENEK